MEAAPKLWLHFVKLGVSLAWWQSLNEQARQRWPMLSVFESLWPLTLLFLVRRGFSSIPPISRGKPGTDATFLGRPAVHLNFHRQFSVHQRARSYSLTLFVDLSPAAT
jgi:hypothetical protein